MNAIRKLAGQTALYGVSSIFGRVLNFLLVPIHTSGIFSTDEFGSITLLYAYVAIFNILYTYGMETAYFRHANKEPQSYNQAFTAILVSSTLFSSGIWLFADPLANLINFTGDIRIIQLLAVIMWIDAVVAIPFARLRHENRVLSFVFARIAGILINVFIQVSMLLVGYRIYQGTWPGGPSWLAYDPTVGIAYLFWANVIGNACMLLMVLLMIQDFRLSWNKQRLHQLLSFGLPIMVAGLLGIIPDQVDKILLENWLPLEFYPGLSNTAVVGIYGATFKLSVFMLLAIQAFRYAGEPYFFSIAGQRETKNTYASILYYFVVAGSILYAGVAMNRELLGFLFIRSAPFRAALDILPLLLLAKFIYGIYLNVSIWYKVTDKTHYGMLFTGIGAAVFLVANLLLIPLIGYWGIGVAMMLCYAAMSVACLQVGSKHYRVPYHITHIFRFLVGTSLFILFTYVPFTSNNWMNFILDMLVFFIYLAVVWLSVGKSLIINAKK